MVTCGPYPDVCCGRGLCPNHHEARDRVSPAGHPTGDPSPVSSVAHSEGGLRPSPEGSVVEPLFGVHRIAERRATWLALVPARYLRP